MEIWDWGRVIVVIKPHQPELHTREWGYEIWIANNDKYCGKILVVSKDKSCSLQYHKEKDETWFILDGVIRVDTKNGSYNMNIGEVLDIPKGSVHRFTAVGGVAKIIEVSTHHEYSDTYRISQNAEGEK